MVPQLALRRGRKEGKEGEERLRVNESGEQTGAVHKSNAAVGIK